MTDANYMDTYFNTYGYIIVKLISPVTCFIYLLSLFFNSLGAYQAYVSNYILQKCFCVSLLFLSVRLINEKVKFQVT